MAGGKKMVSTKKVVHKTKFQEIWPLLRKDWGWTSKKAPKNCLEYNWIYHSGTYELRGEKAMTDWIDKKDIPNNTQLLQMVLDAKKHVKKIWQICR